MSALATSIPLAAARRRPWLQRLWFSLASVKLGLALLALLTLASIAGTLIESARDTATAQRLVYHSLWFSGLMAALALNVVAATWRSTAAVLALPWMRPLPIRPERILEMPASRRIEAGAPAGRVAEVLAARVGRVAREGASLFAQCGLAQRWGAIVTHAGILLLLGGGVALSIGAHFTGAPASSSIWVGEGLSRDFYLAPSTEVPGTMDRVPLPFTLRLLDFDADYFPHTGVPEAFTSTIELITPGGQRSIHRVDMNQALTWNGWKFSQSSFSILDDRLSARDERLLSQMDGQHFVRLRTNGRLAIELTDTASGRVYPVFDAAPGCRVSIPRSDLAFDLGTGGAFTVMRGEAVLAEGQIDTAGGQDHSPHAHYAVRVDAFYPNYQRDLAGDATNGPSLGNPAIRWTLLRDGEPVGTDLAFQAEHFRGMRFADLPVGVDFTGFEPASLEAWTSGDPITLSLHAVDPSTGTLVSAASAEIGTVVALAQPGEAVHPPQDTASTAPFVARVTGRQPAAYTVLSVMREPAGLKLFFYASFLLFLLGPLLAFLGAHCQVWAWVDEAKGLILVGGRVRGRRDRLPALLDRISNDLQETSR